MPGVHPKNLRGIALLVAGTTPGQEHPRTLAIPFHVVDGMMVLNTIVNNKPATLIFDTGSNNTIISLQLVGISALLPPATVGLNENNGRLSAKVDFETGRQFSVEAENLSAINSHLRFTLMGSLGRTCWSDSLRCTSISKRMLSSLRNSAHAHTASTVPN